MLGNIVGGFIVILVGVTLAPTVNLIAHQESNLLMHNPESRLKSLLDTGQDRSVNTKPCFEYARTTDKGFHNLEGYTVWSHNINKICVNKNELSKSDSHNLMETLQVHQTPYLDLQLYSIIYQSLQLQLELQHRVEKILKPLQKEIFDETAEFRLTS
jgi:hypothetical protein